ncbi:MAG: Flp family type IVb pilin [Alphaproteobacteria bacterium]
MNKIKQFIFDESGATAIEYGLIAALISIVLVVSLGLVGDRLDEVFNVIEDKLVDPEQVTAPKNPAK